MGAISSNAGWFIHTSPRLPTVAEEFRFRKSKEITKVSKTTSEISRTK